MRFLCSAVVSFEALVVLLAIPVALSFSSVSGPVAGGLLAGLAVLLIATAAVLGRPWGIAFGWIVQLLAIASGLLATPMYILGSVFIVLWFLAIRYGRRVDALRAARAAAVDGPPAQA